MAHLSPLALYTLSAVNVDFPHLGPWSVRDVPERSSRSRWTVELTGAQSSLTVEVTARMGGDTFDIRGRGLEATKIHQWVERLLRRTETTLAQNRWEKAREI